jgi:hypothetical protein
MGIIGKLEEAGVSGVLFLTGIVAISASIAEMIELQKAKQMDSDIYRTHIACVALGLAGIITAIVKFTGQFAIFMLIVVLIVLGAITIGVTAKAIDDKRNKGETETDLYKLNIAALCIAIFGIVVGVIVIVLKVMAPTL